MKFNKNMLLLYAVTDCSKVDRQTFYNQIEDVLKGGVTMVQLREKMLTEEEYIREAIRCKKLCHRYNVPLIINDNVNVALESGADGVHVGMEDTPVSEIRGCVPKDFIIGATCKTIEQAKAAERDGADYMGVGAIFPSITKENAIRITNEQLSNICESVSIPAVAIGGISLENVDRIKGCKISGIAVVSAIFSATNIIATTLRLKEKAREVVDNNSNIEGE